MKFSIIIFASALIMMPSMQAMEQRNIEQRNNDADHRKDIRKKMAATVKDCCIVSSVLCLLSPVALIVCLEKCCPPVYYKQ